MWVVRSCWTKESHYLNTVLTTPNLAWDDQTNLSQGKIDDFSKMTAAWLFGGWYKLLGYKESYGTGVQHGPSYPCCWELTLCCWWTVHNTKVCSCFGRYTTIKIPAGAVQYSQESLVESQRGSKAFTRQKKSTRFFSCLFLRRSCAVDTRTLQILGWQTQ